MSKEVETIINIVGAALLIGLLLRYQSDAVKLIDATGRNINTLYGTVSLQNVQPGS